MMNRFALLLSALLLIPLPSWSKEKFDRDTLVFLGSSSIALWSTMSDDFPRLKTLNLGRGGSVYADLQTSAPEVIKKYPARRFVIYSGDNDITFGKSPEQVAQDFQAVVESLRAGIPDARFFVISIKPCPAPDRAINLRKVAETNRLIREKAKQLGYVTFIDIYPQMLNERGEPRTELFQANGVHMNAKGYALWTRALTNRLSPGP